jgi:hypothetical protein
LGDLLNVAFPDGGDGFVKPGVVGVEPGFLGVQEIFSSQR